MNENYPREPSTIDRLIAWARGLQLHRDRGGWIGDVSGAVSTKTGMDIVLVRILFVLATVFFGLGICAYLLLWLVSTNQRGELPLELALREGDGGAVVLMVFTVLSVLNLPVSAFNQLDPDDDAGGLLGLGLIAVAVVLIVRSQREKGAPSAPPPPPGTSAGSAPAATAAAPASYRSGYTGWTSTQPAPPPVSYTHRRRGPGGLFTLTVLGLTTIVTGLVMLVPHSAPAVPLAVAAGLAVLAIAIIVCALRGRRSGFLGFLTVVTMLVGLTVGVSPAPMWENGPVGEHTWVVTEESRGEVGRLSLGEGRLDLTQFEPDGRREVSASVGTGSLTVVVPQDTTVKVITTVGLGEVQESPRASELAVTKNSTGYDSYTGSNVLAKGSDLHQERVYGSGEPSIIVHVEVGLGNVRIDREA